MPYGKILTDSITDSSGGVLAPSSSVFRNRIINGAMVIDQRNAGASVTPTSTAYTLDRWTTNLTQSSKFSVQQNAGSITPPTGYSNYLGVTSLSAYSVLTADFFALLQNIEGFNFSDLAWGTASAATVTLSFWVRSSLTGTFGGSITNSAINRSYPFSYTINSANTWEQKSITIAGDTTGTWIGATNGVGARVYFSLGAGATYSGTSGTWAGATYTSPTGATSVVGTSGATFYITGVQLEKGSTATSFDYRPYGTELALCQRYLYVVSVDTNFNYFGQAFSTTAASALVPLPIQPRVAPTGITTSGTIVMTTANGSSSGGTLAFKSGTLDHCIVGVTGGAGLVAGNSSSLLSLSGTQTIQFTGCEL